MYKVNKRLSVHKNIDNNSYIYLHSGRN